MKNIIISLSFLFLSGCAVIQPIIDRFTIAPFDSNEYALVNKVRTIAIKTKPKCSIENIAPFAVLNYVNELHDNALLLKNYSQYIPKNDQTIKPVNLTYQMIDELKSRYEKEKKVGEVYCVLKIQSIIDATESIQQAIAKRPRP